MRTRLLPVLLALSALWHARGKLDTDEDFEDSGNQDVDSGEDINNRTKTEPPQTRPNDNLDQDDSAEGLGAAVSQIYRHPYTATLLKNESYVCSAVILNTYWLLTQSKCFDSDVISSYVTHRHLSNYSVRVGSTYNNKGGSINKIKMLINNFDMKVSAVKLEAPLKFGSRVRNVALPSPDEEVTLGFVATMLAWTPAGHMRVVNAPVIDACLCESFTKLLPGHYICIGGVQDPNRHFCRVLSYQAHITTKEILLQRDNGGAIIQNNTLVAISSFLHTCALYSRSHAFPKVSSFSRWLDSVIWDEDNRPTTTPGTTSDQTTKTLPNATQTTDSRVYQDPRKYMFSLPFDPINVPLEPAEDNSVIPRVSLYESYLQNMARAKTSTTMDPNTLEQHKRDWIKKFGDPGLLIAQKDIRMFR